MELGQLVQKCREDPLLGRMYSPKYVFALFEYLDKQNPNHPFLKEHCFRTYFDDPCKIHHVGVREFVFDFFTALYLSKDENMFKCLLAYRPRLDYNKDNDDGGVLCIEKILTDQSLFYQGKTLVITPENKLFSFLKSSSEELLRGCPKV